jgi:hypothetical protein
MRNTDIRASRVHAQRGAKGKTKRGERVGRLLDNLCAGVNPGLKKGRWTDMMGNMRLTPEEIDCLQLVSQRSSSQEQMISAHGTRLIKGGYIKMNDGWPVLTSKGLAVIDDLAFRNLPSGSQHIKELTLWK